VVNRIEGWVHATPKPTRLLASVGGESDPSSEQRTVRIAVLHSRSAAAATVCLIVNVVAVARPATPAPACGSGNFETRESGKRVPTTPRTLKQASEQS
jgi:hypothetical protein